MFLGKRYISIFMLGFGITCFAQTGSIFPTFFVKENSILLRWVPANKQVFDLAVKNGYRITRSIKENEDLTDVVTIAKSLTPLPGNDSIAWDKLVQKNQTAALAFKILYESGKDPAEKMLYDLMLLNCDFDADIAKACGLFFKDSTIEKNRIYVYKIEINNPSPGLKIVPANIQVNSQTLSVNPPINNFSGVLKNKIAKLKWNINEFENFYGAYNIERSLNNLDYKKINSAPVILLTSQFEKNKVLLMYEDTVPDTKNQYYYRIRGINVFGEESDPSNVVSGTGYEELTSSPIIDSLKIIQNKKVFLHWKMKDEKENNLPKEYVLMRSEKDNGPYFLINSSKQPSSFLDENPKQSNYYKIGSVTLGNDTVYSFSRLALIADTIPPSVPTGVIAKVDAKGNVEITWNKNPENDVKGYKIFKSNALSEEFVQLNNDFAITTFYKDKLNLNTLSKKIYYSVVATDNTYNNSNLSAPVEVKRPDTIPPVSPVIKGLEIMPNGIKISWIPSSSEDVKEYALYHQGGKLNSEAKIKVWPNADSSSSFIDSLTEFSMGYTYKIVATDEDGNNSVSNTPYMLFETGFRKKITNAKAEVDRSKKTITLSWSYPENEVEKFIIYRSRPGEPLAIIKTVPFQISAFEDNSLNIGNTYEYRIKAVFNNGAESIISDAIPAEY